MQGSNSAVIPHLTLAFSGRYPKLQTQSNWNPTRQSQEVYP